jgi:hypothetical protein
MTGFATGLLALAALLTLLFVPLVSSIGVLRGPDSAGAVIQVFLLAIVRGAVWAAGMALAAAAGLGALLSYDPLTAEARDARERQWHEDEERTAKRSAALASLPENATVEALLAFAEPADPWPVRSAVLERIRRIDGYLPQLAAALDGPRALMALSVLREESDPLPPEIEERCRQAAARSGSQ